MKNFKLNKLATRLAAIALAAPVLAQSLVETSASKDWKVFVDENNAGHCYVVSTPTSSAAFKGDEQISVSRGEIRLYIGVKNGVPEPAFVAGYPLSTETNPIMQIGDNVYNFFINTQVDAQYAWPDPKRDQDIISGMKSGVEAIMTGVSQRGTKTVDKFSLSGFTAAYQAALDKCK